MTFSDFSSLLPGVAGLFLAGVGLLLHRLAAPFMAEKTIASQAARLVDTLGSVAGGIAQTIQNHPPAPADMLNAVKNAAIAQGVVYAKQALPDTIKALGISDDTLASRLANEVAGALLSAPKPLVALPQILMSAVADVVGSATAPVAATTDPAAAAPAASAPVPAAAPGA